MIASNIVGTIFDVVHTDHCSYMNDPEPVSWKPVADPEEPHQVCVSSYATSNMIRVNQEFYLLLTIQTVLTTIIDLPATTDLPTSI